MSTDFDPREERRWAGGINYSELRKALDFLEVSLPVEIKRANGIHRRGAHRFRAGRHVITLSTYSAVAGANRVLLHELTHAAQCERYGPEKFAALYREETRRRGGGRTGYVTNCFEVEANAAKDFAADFIITK